MATKNNPPPSPQPPPPPARPARPGPSLEFSAEHPAYAELVPTLRTRLRKTLPHLPRHVLEEVSIALVGNKTMSRLHGQSHDDPTPTDVLTYETDHTPRGAVTQGQIVICIPEARKRAREYTIALSDEVLLYALHGLLHLCGMDDKTPAGFKRMHKTEDHILTAIGVGVLFHRSARA